MMSLALLVVLLCAYRQDEDDILASVCVVVLILVTAVVACHTLPEMRRPVQDPKEFRLETQIEARS
jgi:multisubunit Na+/H+ antiporter MnhG subunit